MRPQDAGPVARREAPRRRRQDARARRRRARRPAGSSSRSSCRPRARRSSDPRGRVAADPRAGRGRPAELHRPRLRPRRPPSLHEQRQRQRQGLRGRSGRRRRAVALDPAAAGRRAAPGGGDPGRAGPLGRRRAGSTSAATCPTACSSSTRPRGRSCGPSTSASRPSTSSSPAARPTSATGAAAVRRRATSPARPGRAPRSGSIPVRHIASEGSVTRRRPGRRRGQGRDRSSGLHASALALSPDGRYVVCANAASDNLSVIDTATDAVVETIWAKASPGRPLRRLAQRPGLRRERQDALRRQRHPERRGGDQVQPAEEEIAAQGAHPRRLVPGRHRRRRDARDGLCVANIKGHALEPRRYQAGRRAGLQLPPVPRLDLDRPRAAAEGALGA
ncbi:MAG: hypothetical protein M0C28_07335 [Candidatus Moduliflexus flocculans]|nr:hypothetical protein [Candidatus Moduliflexus flocculans]